MLQYFISTHGARKGLADTALKTANSGYLTRRLVDVAQDSIISERGLRHAPTASRSAPLVEGGEIIERLGERILGRVALEDVARPDQRRGARAARATRSTRTASASIEDAGIEQVQIRSVLTCEVERGVCVTLLRARPRARPDGEPRRGGRRHRGAVDRRAGHAAHDADLPHRRHGDAARRAVARTRRATRARSASSNLRTVTRPRGPPDRDEPQRRDRRSSTSSGRERERYPVVYGAHVKVDGRPARARPATCCSSGIRSPTRSSPRSAARVKFGDIVEGVTMQEQVDEFTGLSSKVIIESKDPELRPRISIKNEAGDDGGARAAAGRRAPRRDRGRARSRPATCSRRSRARPPRPRTSRAVCRASRSCSRRASRRSSRSSREIDGIVVVRQGHARQAPRDRHARARRRAARVPDPEGQAHQRARGRPRARGRAAHGRLARTRTTSSRIKGEKELAKYLVDEVQEVYRLQGVRINDKHIEVIVRQMLRRVRIKEVGDTDFLVGEQVEKWRFEEENAADGRPRASSRPTPSRCCSASPRRRSRPSASSRPPRSRRPPRCSPRPRSGARSTTCAGSRRT